jgi:hypothetical protein
MVLVLPDANDCFACCRSFRNWISILEKPSFDWLRIRSEVVFFTSDLFEQNRLQALPMAAWLEVRGGPCFLLNKTQSPSPRVELGPKPNFFIYVVKPKPKLSPPYLVKFSSPKWPSLKDEARARKNQARPTSRRGPVASSTPATEETGLVARSNPARA